MNRLHHIEQTFLKNINDNISTKNIEFILLDYNSNDGLEEWVRTNCVDHIDSGLVKFFITREPQYFNRSHSRNLAFKLANGELLCNVDADNYLGENFAEFIVDNFSNNKNIFLTAASNLKDTIGKVCFKKTDFYNVNGYNESFQGYGFEDMEFYARLGNLGLKRINFYEQKFMKVINHQDRERTNNDYHTRQLQQIYIRYISPSESEIIIFYKNQKFERAILIDELKNIGSLAGQFDQNETGILGIPLQGQWERRHDIILQKVENEIKVLQIDNENLRDGAEIYYKIGDRSFMDDIQFLFASIKNRNIRNKSAIEKSIKVNINGFGSGQVKDNFGVTINL
jgi:hypothetical protein